MGEDHLLKAKCFADMLEKHPLDVQMAQAHALIAIAEELREMNAREWEKRQ